jgi:hypothetical protein
LAIIFTRAKRGKVMSRPNKRQVRKEARAGAPETAEQDGGKGACWRETIQMPGISGLSKVLLLYRRNKE